MLPVLAKGFSSGWTVFVQQQLEALQRASISRPVYYSIAFLSPVLRPALTAYLARTPGHYRCSSRSCPPLPGG
jgi:hypothetical protein